MKRVRKINNTENIVVFLLVAWAMMEFFYHFRLFKEGGLGPTVESLRLNILFQAFITIYLFFVYNNKSNLFDNSKTNKSIVLGFAVFLGLYSMLNCLVLNFFGVLGNMLTLAFMTLFLLLRDSVKIRILDSFITVLAVFLSFSVIEFLIYAFTGFKYVLYADLYYGDYPFDQTLFNYIPTLSGLSNFTGFANFFRFRSLADEPGGVGTTCAFLLFATSGVKKYKYHYIVFWVAGIMSFSLAFFLLAFIHLVSILFTKKSITGILALVVILGALYMVFQEAFDYYIFERVTGDDVDNRVTDELEKAIDAAWADGSILFGHDNENVKSAGSGVKLAIYNSGLIAICFLVLGYIQCFLKTMKYSGLVHKNACIFFFIAFWISYYQRAYILMFQYVLPYFVMPLFMAYNERIKRAEKQVDNKLEKILI